MNTPTRSLQPAEPARRDGASVVVERAVPPLTGSLRFTADEVHVHADRSPQLVDVTSEVEATVRRSGVRHGHVVLFCRHTTASVVLNEDEPLLHEDIEEFLEQMASARKAYRHDDFSVRTENLVPDHGLNAHAHLKHLVLGASLTLPVLNGRPALGSWQRVFFLEMDRPKTRVLLLQVSGVTA